MGFSDTCSCRHCAGGLGAINLALDALPDFHPGQEIVAYCRGPACVLSYEAVALLRARGFKARRLEDGLPEWRAARLPVEIGIPR